MIGKTLTHYKVLDQIGEGGMGAVYVAEDLNLGRKVALKILREEMASSADRLERFRREAQAVAALNHPNIVTIHSIEEAPEGHFITMELVQGKGLDEIVTGDGLCRGQTVVDHRSVTGRPPNVHVVTRVDRAGFVALLHEACR